VQESSETYLLSGAGDNVKVRDALMDIKVLREVNQDGLEQWTPVMKAGFPLPAAEVTKVFEALRLDPPVLVQQRLWPVAGLRQRVGRKAKRCQPCNRARLRIRQRL
jgi:exopolyphosphatase/guanosine-5'-triphosphate,3'-diphosphate pyrophosphatase